MTDEKRRPGGDPGAPQESLDRQPVDASSIADIAPLRRRRHAAQRLPVLRCGCGDPWHPEPLAPSERNLIASRAAWHHLRAVGLLSEVSVRVLAEAVIE